MSIVSDVFGERVAPSEKFPELGRLLARIKEAYNPIDVILYGSRARGEATSQSDWDIKVIVADDAPDQLLSPMFGWRVQEGSGVYADLTCARLSEFCDDLRVANSAASHIVEDGLVLRVH
ncbi:nucleotidyltransferase domain-containing protein [Agrobacterium salinitolerans]|nr:nucleotidyltransferase domain-containing protein [Agrobacterium salinitolerans]